MAAAGAAIVAGSTAIARPKAVVSANTSGLDSSIRAARASLPPPTPAPDDTLAFVRRILKECRVVGHQTTVSAGDLTRCSVTYRHDPNGRQTKEDLEWEQYLADARMVSVVVSTSADELDVTHLGGYSTWPIAKARHDVEIEYIVFPKGSKA